MAALEGWKTYIAAGLLFAAAILKYAGVVDADFMNMLITILVGGGLMTLRSGVKSDVAKAVERREDA